MSNPTGDALKPKFLTHEQLMKAGLCVMEDNNTVVLFDTEHFKASGEEFQGIPIMYLRQTNECLHRLIPAAPMLYRNVVSTQLAVHQLLNTVTFLQQNCKAKRPEDESTVRAVLNTARRQLDAMIKSAHTAGSAAVNGIEEADRRLLLERSGKVNGSKADG